MIPLPPAARRPCALIGLSLALVFSAAMVDAFFWQQGVERDEMRSQVAAAQVHAEMLAAENTELRQELARNRLEQLSAEHQQLIGQAEAMHGCLRDPFDAAADEVAAGDRRCQQRTMLASEHRAEIERLVNGAADY